MGSSVKVFLNSMLKHVKMVHTSSIFCLYSPAAPTNAEYQAAGRRLADVVDQLTLERCRSL